jgi:hypothetical protein
LNIAGEISYDLVMENDMSFVEGCFRLPHGVWQVVIISKDDVTSPQIKLTEWDSGIKGVFIQYPQDKPLNSEKVEYLLSSIYNVKHWITVRGPDSMDLR